MTKEEYIAELRARLVNLSNEEREAAVKYYDEYFTDAGIGNEESVIKELGTPEYATKQILRGINREEESSSEYVPAKFEDIKKTQEEKKSEVSGHYTGKKATSRKGNWLFVLIVVVLFFPVIAPVISVLFGLFIGLLAMFLGIWFAIGAVMVALIIAGIAGIIGGIAASVATPLVGACLIGVGLIILGLGILMFYPLKWFTVIVIPALFKGGINLMSKLFRRKEVA